MKRATLKCFAIMLLCFIWCMSFFSIHTQRCSRSDVVRTIKRSCVFCQVLAIRDIDFIRTSGKLDQHFVLFVFHSSRLLAKGYIFRISEKHFVLYPSQAGCAQCGFWAYYLQLEKYNCLYRHGSIQKFSYYVSVPNFLKK